MTALLLSRGMKIIAYKITSQFHCCSVASAQCTEGLGNVYLCPSSFMSMLSAHRKLPCICTYVCKRVGREIGGYLSKYFRFMSNFYQGVAEQELERDIERSFILLIRGAKDMVREFLEMELDFTTQFSYSLL